MIKAIIFDFFDVIRTDAYKAWLNANNIPHTGPYFDASYQQDMGNITVDDFLDLLSKLQGRPVTREELDASAKVDQDVVEIIAQLRKTYKTTLLSNAPSAVIREILAEHDLEKYFDVIIVSSEVGYVKPSPEIFNLTLEELGLTVAEAIFIDDNKKHTDAAAAFGIQSIQFHSAKQLTEELHNIGINEPKDNT
jgi:HAD superfamily hydrolase (TIGR01509 family)